MKIDIFKKFIGIIFSPREVFLSLSKSKESQWIVAGLVLGVGYATLNLFINITPEVLHAKALGLMNVEENLSFFEAEAKIRSLAILGMFLIPLLVFSKLFIISRISFGIASIFPNKKDFKNSLTVVSFTEVIPFSGYFLSFIFLLCHRPGPYAQVQDLKITLGLNLLSIFNRAEIGLWKYTFLQECDFFTMWYIIVLTLGISFANRLRIRYSFLIALILFVSKFLIGYFWVKFEVYNFIPQLFF